MCMQVISKLAMSGDTRAGSADESCQAGAIKVSCVQSAGKHCEELVTIHC